MSKKLKRSNQSQISSSYQSDNLHSIFRSQIVQQYPYSHNNFHLPYQQSEIKPQLKQQPLLQEQDDMLERYLNGSDIVQGYEDLPFKSQQKQQIKLRGEYNYGRQSMEIEYFHPKKIQIDNFLDRPASRSSDGDSILKNSRQNSIDKLPFFMRNCHDSQSQMDIEINNNVNHVNPPFPFIQPQREVNYFHQQPMYVKNQSFASPNPTKSYQRINHPNYQFGNKFYENPAISVVKLSQKSSDQIFIENKERQDKIAKIQKIGCKCRKSKCLKMYCQCFHLQIFCNQNCDCVGCGNMQSTHEHKQAVIEALTRNPKAFSQGTQNVDTSNAAAEKQFKLGVDTSQIKRGCRCKKTKCRKKYCQCFNAKVSCGLFCKCQECQNGKCDH